MNPVLNGNDHRLEYDDGQLFTTLHRRPECVIAQRIRAQLTEASELWHD